MLLIICFVILSAPMAFMTYVSSNKICVLYLNTNSKLIVQTLKNNIMTILKVNTKYLLKIFS